MIHIVLITLLISHGAHSQRLIEDVAAKPPMGWSSWLAYGCSPCNYYKTECLSDTAIQNTARLLDEKNYSQLGYKYIILDDCWQGYSRTDNWKLQPDKLRFPDGIHDLAKYVHSKGLKLGIFSDLGTSTGSGRPGSSGFFELDANTFAEWEVDYIKMSAASAPVYILSRDYPLFKEYMNRTKRPMVYATSWPVYQEYSGFPVSYSELPLYCNTWRFSVDVQPNWSSILAIMDHYYLRQTQLRAIVRPRAWNDADLLVAGLPGVTLDQSHAQMAVWAIIASPLIFSTDMHKITPDIEALLKNPHVIAVDQDLLAIPGYRLNESGDIDIWIRPISPKINEAYSYAIAFVNRNQYGSPVDYSVELKKLGLNHPDGYYITDLFFNRTLTSGQIPYNLVIKKPHSKLEMKINPSGVAFFKAEVIVNIDTVGSLATEAALTSSRPYNIDGVIRY